jgi:hypothetical protein
MEDLEDQNPPDSSFVIAALAIMLLTFLLFRHFGRVDLALPASICLGMAVCLIRIRWDLRKRFWFWATILLVLLLHVPVILLVRFPRMTVNRVTLLPIGFADLLIVWGAVRFVEIVRSKFHLPDQARD